MKKQITHISPHQTSKIMAVLYVIFTLPFMVVGIFTLLFSDSPESSFSLFFIAAPIIYGVLGYVFTILGCWIYNFVAKRLCGFEFTAADQPTA